MKHDLMPPIIAARSPAAFIANAAFLGGFNASAREAIEYAMFCLSALGTFQLERYISAEYFGELRDTWSHMVDLLKSSLAKHNANTPENRGSRPLHERPEARIGRAGNSQLPAYISWAVRRLY